MGGDTRVTARPAGRPRYARHVWLTRLYRRFRHLVHELGKFGTVGLLQLFTDERGQLRGNDMKSGMAFCNPAVQTFLSKETSIASLSVGCASSHLPEYVRM